MNITTIIVAGGNGSRMGSETPKQFLLLGGLPVLMQTIIAMRDSIARIGGVVDCREQTGRVESVGSVERGEDPEGDFSWDSSERTDSYESSEQIGVCDCSRRGGDVNNYVNTFVVVLPQSQIAHWKQLCFEYGFDVNHHIAVGGESRFASVRSGLGCVDSVDIVLIHDGVRPLVDENIVRGVVNAAVEDGAAIPVIEVVDSLREVVNNSLITLKKTSRIVNRSSYRAVQTPQAFRTDIIMEAYKQQYDPMFTDDASVVESVGHDITLTQGSPSNIKITTQTDLIIAEALMGKTE